MSRKKTGSKSIPEKSEGYQQAIHQLQRCSTEHGFVASTIERENYHRVWGRDSCITGLGAILSGDDDLIDTCRRSLETLADFQGPHGEIPSNVDPVTNEISYGGTTGRVDSNLWFVIACGEYWRHTKDNDFLDRVLEPLDKVRQLLGSWEFNARGLLYIPPTGDWADEYPQSGYVLYDQLLYLQTQKNFCAFDQHRATSAAESAIDKITHLENLLQTNYWLFNSQCDKTFIYHQNIFKKGREKASELPSPYWMPCFSPLGYNYRFDTLANTLAGLFGLANEAQIDAVNTYIDEQVVPEKLKLLPGFSPVIRQQDKQWEKLQASFSHQFKNKPYEYHNGGLWPMVTGFYAASLAERGDKKQAQAYADGIHAANKTENSESGESWGFPEYLNGQTLEAGGTPSMAWSAAAALIAEGYIVGKSLFV